MNDSLVILKWFCRALLVTLAVSMTYVVTRPAYNFAHWLPHDFFRQLGVSHDAMLWGERHADVALHFLGGAVLTSLIYLSALPHLGKRAAPALMSVCTLCVSAEVFQMSIGRGFQSSDLLLGILGAFMAYSLIEKYKY